MTRRGKIACGIIIYIALVAVAACVGPALKGYRQEKRREKTYAQAEALAQGGEYAAALDALAELDDSYRNAKSLSYYCTARISYEDGNVSKANNDLFWCDHYMASGEIMPEGYEDFQAEVSAKYAVYAAEQRQKEQEAYRERVRTGVPFVGMSEADIANTSLGAPSPKVGHNSEWERGKRVTANLYYFYKDGRLIFSVRCLHGSVDQVWADRDEPPASSAKSFRKSSVREEDEDDPLNAKDYLFPEDFYEDHFDDFYDFYDAEDYYYDHGGT